MTPLLFVVASWLSFALFFGVLCWLCSRPSVDVSAAEPYRSREFAEVEPQQRARYWAREWMVREEKQ